MQIESFDDLYQDPLGFYAEGHVNKLDFMTNIKLEDAYPLILEQHLLTNVEFDDVLHVHLIEKDDEPNLITHFLWSWTLKKGSRPVTIWGRTGEVRP